MNQNNNYNIVNKSDKSNNVVINFWWAGHTGFPIIQV